MIIFIPVLFACSLNQYGVCQPLQGPTFNTREECLDDLANAISYLERESNTFYVGGGTCIQVNLERGT